MNSDNNAKSALVSSSPIDDPPVGLIIRDHSLQSRGGSNEEQGKRHRRVSINILPDDALIEVFHHCRLDKMRFYMSEWRPLVHVCKRWRQIIFASSRHLRLLLLCNYKTPARKSLDIWPPLPIMIQFYSPKDNYDDIIAALERYDRITCIIFRMSSSDWETLSALMQKPLPALTELSISGKSMLVISETFLGGSAPRLLTCDLDRIEFPALPTFLMSTSQLTDLSLIEIPGIAPDVMVTCLAALPGLTKLSLAPNFKIDSVDLPGFPSSPPLARADLPRLTHFSFKGDDQYLEKLVARIDAPFLNHIDVYFHTFPIHALSQSQLYRLIAHPERLRGAHRAMVALDNGMFSIYNKSGYLLRLNPLYARSGWKISSMARLCNDISPLLSQVASLEIHGFELPEVQSQDDMGSVTLQNFFRPFPVVEHLYVYGELVSPVAHVLGTLTGENVAQVLPVLRSIAFEEWRLSEHIQEVIEPFLVMRQLSDRPVAFSHKIRSELDVALEYFGAGYWFEGR